MQRERSDYKILSVSHALDVMEQLAAHGECGVTELALSLGLHKNNAFRLLATLLHRGYVEQVSPTERYRLGLRALELAQAYRRANPLALRARPLLEALVRESGETAHLGILADFQVSHLEGKRTNRLLGTKLRVGERLPCHSTALGKVLLGCGAPRIREEYDREVVSPHRLERRTPATIVDRDKLFEHLGMVGARGWAIDLEECEAGLACAAVPVFDGGGNLAGGLSISGPTCRLDPDRLEGQIVPLLLRIAEQLSKELGHHP